MQAASKLTKIANLPIFATLGKWFGERSIEKMAKKTLLSISWYYPLADFYGVHGKRGWRSIRTPTPHRLTDFLQAFFNKRISQDCLTFS